MKHVIVLLITLFIFIMFSVSVWIIYTTHIKEFLFLTIGLGAVGFIWGWALTERYIK